MPRTGLLAALLLWGASAGTLILVGVMAFHGVVSSHRTEARLVIPDAPPLPLRLPAKPEPAAMECLSLAMYHEARSEPGLGLRAVGHVIMNRVADPRFPDTVCGVVKQGGEVPPCQFSWWCDGKPDRPVYTGLYRRAEVLAYLLLTTSDDEDPTDGALYFHAYHVAPFWSENFQRTVVIGNHEFYRP